MCYFYTKYNRLQWKILYLAVKWTFIFIKIFLENEKWQNFKDSKIYTIKKLCWDVLLLNISNIILMPNIKILSKGIIKLLKIED